MLSHRPNSFFLFALLAICLLFSGVGAVTHAYSHRMDAEAHSLEAVAGSHPAHKAKSSAAATCELCLAFAGLGFVLPSSFNIVFTLALALAVRRSFTFFFHQRPRIFFRSRAPPTYS